MDRSCEYTCELDFVDQCNEGKCINFSRHSHINFVIVSFIRLTVLLIGNVRYDLVLDDDDDNEDTCLFYISKQIFIGWGLTIIKLKITSHVIRQKVVNFTINRTRTYTCVSSYPHHIRYWMTYTPLIIYIRCTVLE